MTLTAAHEQAMDESVSVYTNDLRHTFPRREQTYDEDGVSLQLEGYVARRAESVTWCIQVALWDAQHVATRCSR